MLISSSSWRLPVAKSLKSCAGVTFTAPVPNLGSTRMASVMMGKRAVDERVLDALAVQRRVARVVGVHGDRGVAEHRLGARRRDDDLAAALDLVGELEELAVRALLVLDLEVAERRHALGAPVDEARGAVHQALLVEAHERLGHRAAHVRVHRELGARPVGRSRRGSRCWRSDAAAALAPSTARRARRTPRARASWRVLPSRASCRSTTSLRGDAGVIGARAARACCSRACGASERARPRACTAGAWPMWRRARHVGRRHRARRRRGACRSGESLAAKTPCCSQKGYQRGSTSAGS